MPQFTAIDWGLMETTAQSKSRSVLTGLITLALGVLAVAGMGVTLHHSSKDPQPKEYATISGTIVGPDGKTYPHAFLKDGVYPDPISSKAHGTCATCDGGHPTWPSYGPYTHFVLPAHAYVTIDLIVYDSGGNLNTPYFGNVVGTVGGTATYDGVAKANLDPTTVEHTWTLHGVPSSTQDSLFVNVPLPLNTDSEMKAYNADPTVLPKGHVVEFSFITGGKGEYVWNCEYPCGDTSYQGFGAVMGSATGYMSGKVSVI